MTPDLRHTPEERRDSLRSWGGFGLCCVIGFFCPPVGAIALILWLLVVGLTHR